MGGARRWALVCVLLAPACASTQVHVASGKSASRDEHAALNQPAEPKKEPPHPVIEAYVSSLSAVLSDAEKQALLAIDLGGTNVGDTQRLRYLAADRAVRVFLPAALEASRNPVLNDYAARIRALPPLLNPDTDSVAHELVTAALRARAQLERGEPLQPPSLAELEATAKEIAPEPKAPSEPVEAAQLPSDSSVSVLRTVDDGAAEEYAEALAMYAETYQAVFGVSKMHADSAAAAAADAADAAVLLTEAIARGADREELVREGISLVERMAQAARRREFIPIPKGKPKATAE